ncbi:MAG: TlpA family protein disulfide reductase [Bdellovibrionales bacterium]|nr:TlpA family protein disulfide reductase [Massilia sp.]
MDAIKLGPLVVPMQVALLLASILLANGIAAWFRREQSLDPGPILWKMTLFGFGLARLSFVLRHHDVYFSTPVSILDFRDGGVDSLAGFAAAFVAGAALTKRSTALRRPLSIATLAGCVFFLAGTLFNQTLLPAQAPVPPVELRRLDGSTVSLNKFVGRPLIINLWATWCPPCRREMPVLKSAQQAHPEVEFVFVSQGESADTVRQYLSAQGLQMSNVTIDPAKQLSTRTGSSGYPTTLFYDTKGRLSSRHMGELSAATLEDKINQLLDVR